MKILLVNPTLGGDFSAMCIGLTALATFINEKTKHEARILDFTFQRKNWKKHLWQTIRKSNPDVIGIGSSSLYVPYARKIAREIKKRKDIKIILGGWHPTLLPAETLILPEFDAVCIGEGEYALSEYLDCIEKGEKPIKVKGIWYKDGQKIIKNPLMERIKDLDELPIPDWNRWKDLNKYFFFLGMIYFVGMKGCPYNCTYCGEQSIRNAVPGKYFRAKSARNYAKEIKHQWDKYKNKGFRLAQLFDPVFTFDRKWMTEFCDEYKRLGLARKLPFSVFARSDNLDEDKIKTLAEGGCKIVRIGIEAGDERIRNEVYEKKISTSQVKQIVNICKKYKIAVTGYFMLGGPGESKKTLNKTFQLAKDLDLERPAFFIFTPLPTTEVLKKIQNEQSIVDQKRSLAIDNFTFGATIESNDLTTSYVEKFHKKVYAYFMLRRIIRIIKKEKHRYFINLIVYITKGLMTGLDVWYMLGYFHMYYSESMTM